MKKVMQVTFVSSLLLMMSSGVFANVSKNTGYKNQRGSSMDLVWNAGENNAGTITGTFTTAVSKCKAAIGKAMPLTGVYNGNAVALTVNYPECGVVVAMSGNLNQDRSEMHLHWFVTRQGGSSLHESWDTTTTGVDHYKEQP